MRKIALSIMLLKIANKLFNVCGVDPDTLMQTYLAPECEYSGEAAVSMASPAVSSASSSTAASMSSPTVSSVSCPTMGSIDNPTAGSIAKSTQPIYTINITTQLINEERRIASEAACSNAYLARIALLRQIAEIGPQLGIFVAHMAVLEYQGLAWAFAAPSGVGKSTHLRLWKESFGDDVTIINGDKPLFKLDSATQISGNQHSDTAETTDINDAVTNHHPTITVYGSPWAGKEGWHTNMCAPLVGICFLTRGTQDKCRRIDANVALPRALKQIYMPTNTSSALLTLDFLDVLMHEVPLFELSCTMSKNAVKASFEALTGLNFESCAKGRKHEN